MAIKFYRAKALPSSLNSSHDGVWFIKPDGATSFRTYNVKDGVAVGDGFEDLEIGGRNYVRKIAKYYRAERCTVTEISDDILDFTLNYHLGSAYIQLSRYAFLDIKEGYYTLSFTIENKQNSVVPLSYGVRNAGVSDTITTLQPLEVRKIVEVLYLQNTNNGYIILFGESGYSTPLSYVVSNVKLEKGTIATDWTPAPEDKEDAFSKNTAFNKNFGTTADTVTERNDVRRSNSREWTASTVSQSEAQSGTSTTRRAWSALRVRQAITAWWNTIVDTIAEKTWVSANFDKYGFWNLKTNGVQRKMIQAQNDVDFVAGNNMNVDYGAGGVVLFSAQDTPLNDAILAGNEISHDATVDIVNGHNFMIQRNVPSPPSSILESTIGLLGNGLNFGISLNAGQKNTNNQSYVVVRKSYVSLRNTNGDGIGISTTIGAAVYHAYLKTDNITGNRTVQFPNKSGTLALEEDIDTKIEEYFDNNPVAENLTYPLEIVDHEVCNNITNNDRYLFTGEVII